MSSRQGQGRGIVPTHEQEVVVNVPELPVVSVIAQLPNIEAVNSDLFISILEDNLKLRLDNSNKNIK
jgi:hypothetical protein